ncbi:MAG: hypothetical protein ISP01_05225 [Methanobrevibacter arboriphilus]|uniref:Uncharacterized protein n=1 Tax=Methanobrevibacter arboriphilus TaxID=39441 RepID=A0A843ANB9_METAZ|nr:hypothetical protein [Methanobrevibacter arboriphilus]MBF4468789.1 hypothetical protein [Methanobrevibacter arboriphilus]
MDTMEQLDLDLLNKDERTVRLFGKDIRFKTLTVQEHLKNESTAFKLEQLSYDNEEDLKKAADLVIEYIMNVLELNKKEASKITMEQYTRLRQYMGRQELYDQGFNDKEIDKIEKEAAKKQMQNILK